MKLFIKIIIPVLHVHLEPLVALKIAINADLSSFETSGPCSKEGFPAKFTIHPNSQYDGGTDPERKRKEIFSK